jgi:hypothetical protein
MTNAHTPPGGELPSSRSLLRSTLIAAAVAAVILVTIVLPAEYGVDPTGIGRVLGLKQMGEIKVALAKEAAADTATAPDSTPTVVASPVVAAAPADSQAAAPSPASSHETTVTLRPGEGKEIKLAMRKGAIATYAWSTDRGVVNYDTHGDSLGAPKSYHNYAKGTGKASDEGTLTAAFDGMHGWFWRNRTSSVVTVTLRTSGDYQELKRMN